MAEAGVDISGYRAKRLDELKGGRLRLRCHRLRRRARELPPFFPGARKLVHRSFDDPPRLAKEAKTEEEALAHYRRVRDEIRAFVESMPEELEKE